MTSGPPTSKLSPERLRLAPQTPRDTGRRRRGRSAASASRPSAGRSSRAGGRRARRSSRSAALPGPTTIAARSVVTGTEPAASSCAVSRRLRRCGESRASRLRARRGRRAAARPLASASRATVSRRQPVALREVTRPEGVHEVVGDLDALQGAAHGVPSVASATAQFTPLPSCGRRETATTSCRSGERGEQRVADRARGPEDRDPHVPPRGRAGRSSAG